MIDYEQDGAGLAHIVWNNPDGPVNIKNAAAMTAFARAVDRAIGDDSVKGVLIRSAKRDFVAGGDLMALYAARTPEEAGALVRDIGTCLRRMERAPKPFVAVLNGSALGGGLELALACHHRIAVDDPRLRLGAPEVTLGLVPGAGGTQRLPRLIGIAAAAGMLVEGRPIGVRDALERGLVDQVVPIGQEVEAARRVALMHPDAGQPWDRAGFRYPGFQPGSPEAAAFFKTTRAEVQRRWPKADLAPHAVVELLAEGTAVDLDHGLRAEARQFARVATSSSAKNRIRVQFIAPGAIRRSTPAPDETGADPARIGVIGAGTMGAGIAAAAARAGMATILIDQSDAALDKGLQRIARTLDAEVERRRMTVAQRDAALARIEVATGFTSLQDCPIVIEAVNEDPTIKQAVFQRIVDAAGLESVVASNTSTLSITAMAAGVQRPARFIGLHFFAPVDRMALVEVIRGRETDERTLARSLALLRTLGKTPVVVNDGPGFYTSRVVAAYTREALQMLGTGVTPTLIDRAARTAGFAIGPLAMADLTSYDLLRDILGSLARTGRGTAADSQAALDAVDRLLAAGRVGRKGAGGVYDVLRTGEQPKGGVPTAGVSTGGMSAGGMSTGEQVWDGLAAVFPPLTQQPPEDEVIERLLDIQSIETAHAMAEGIASDPLALDLAAVLGWRYPAFRGGVLAHMDDTGLARFVARSDARVTAFGPRFAVPSMLRDMAASGATFHGGG